ncbi:hypothetical protein KP509_02G074800 [Ceratopteris richardii]|uniref:Uncharacterized protein n=1 Tax=Ceratopteris richardii TaxID=49495 RepID=A0A8T2VAE4_CERRI|nr:hypothetical protein KP509_02G074800 [Ceratopteris richardii]
MAVFSIILGFSGFLLGLIGGFLIGYVLFIYWRPTDVKTPVIKPLGELDSETLESLLPEIPLWVKNPDYDRVDWLNKFVRDLWPYLDKAICKTIKEITQPMIEEYSAKFKFDSIEFERLTLGAFPPTLQGIKAFDTHESEMIIEPALKWAGNPDILIAVKVFGIRATIQLVDLQFSGIIRLTFKPLLSSFPCFSKIAISIMEKPHIDFGLKLLGGDLMAIPILYGYVQDMIKKEIGKLYLWPKIFHLVLLDESEVSMKKPVGLIEVKVLYARNLRKADIIGKSDPYIKISLGEKGFSKKTQVKKNTLNPDWNETHTLVVQDPSIQVLEFHAYDWDKISSHDKLGMETFPLASLEPEVPKCLTLNLRKNMDDNDSVNQKLRGQLVVEVTYKPFKQDLAVQKETEAMTSGPPQAGGLLVITVHGAHGLEGKRHTNPYAKVVYQGEEYKTKPLKRNRNPRWPDGEFEIGCDKPPLNEMVRIEIMSKSSRFGIHLKIVSNLSVFVVGALYYPSSKICS